MDMRLELVPVPVTETYDRRLLRCQIREGCEDEDPVQLDRERHNFRLGYRGVRMVPETNLRARQSRRRRTDLASGHTNHSQAGLTAYVTTHPRQPLATDSKLRKYGQEALEMLSAE